MKKRMKPILALLAALVLLLSLLQPVGAYAAKTLSVPASVSVYKGFTKTLTVKYGGKKIAASKLTFKSSKKSVATVSSKGVIKGVKAGTARVTVTLKSNKKIKKTCTVTVKGYKKGKISTDASALTFSVGGTKQMAVKLNGANAGGGSLNYSSTDKSVVTIDKNGKITGRKKGKALVIATAKRVKNTYVAILITVKNESEFAVTPQSLPLNGYALNFSTYNEKTRQYYVLRSYLEWFEKKKKGTLTVKAGTYNIPVSLYIPSNVTLKLKDGVVLNKTYETGVSSLGASGSMFMLVEPSKCNTDGAHSLYDGVHDVKVLGEGTVVMNMNGTADTKKGAVFVMCHNDRCAFDNLTFKNIVKGHFFELDASRNVTITNCSFENQGRNSMTSAEEAINLDTPDKNTKGFTQPWTSYDCTPNDGVRIASCTFKKVQRAVGTHQYTEGKYHNNVVIEDCTFTDCLNGGVSVMNWTNAVIRNNRFVGIGYDEQYNQTKTSGIDTTRGIVCSGIRNITIEGNTFKYVYEPMRFTPHTLNSYNGYAPAENEILPNETWEAMAASNYIVSGCFTNGFMRVCNTVDGSLRTQGDFYLTVINE